MKRIISWLLALVMLLSSLPLQAVAQTQYTRDFVIAKYHAEAENEFRAWASALVEDYRNEYLCLDSNNEFRTETVNMYNRINGYLWNTSPEIADMCLYHPYYELAKKKLEYDLSSDANKVSNDKIIKETEYTLPMMDEKQLREVYMWILQETVMEKAELDEDFFTQQVDGDEKLYTFSVSTGGMVLDDQKVALADITINKACASVATTLTSALALAVETYIAWGDLKNAVGDAAKKIGEEASGKKNYLEEIKDKAIKNLLNTLTTTLKDSINTWTEEASKSFQNSVVNGMRDQLACDYANALLIADANIIGYFRTTYVDNPHLVKNDPEFQAFVEEAIELIDSEAFKKALGDAADLEVTEDLVKKTMKGIEHEEVLTGSEIAKIVASTAFSSAMNGLLTTITDALSAGLKALKEELISDKAPDMVTDALTVLFDALEKAIEEASRRGSEAVKEIAKEVKDTDISFETVSQALSDQFSGSDDKEEPKSYGTYLLELLRDEFVSFLLGRFSLKERTEAYETKDEREAEKIQETASEIKTPDTDYSVSLGELGKLIRMTLIDIAKAVIGEIEAGLKSAQVSTEVLTEAKEMLAQLNNTLTEIEKSKTGSSELITQMSWFLTDVLDWIWEMEKKDEYAALYKVLNDSIEKLDYGVVAGKTLKNWMGDKDLISKVVEVFGGYNMSDVKAVCAVSYTNDEAIEESIRQKATDLYKKMGDSIGATFENTAATVTKLWGSMMDVSANLALAANSTMQNVAGDHSASLESQRVFQTYKRSKHLEGQLRILTEGGRIGVMNRHPYEHFLELYVSGKDAGQLKYTMNGDDILDPMATPDLAAIKVLTDNILCQINLDMVGMGSYLFLVRSRTEYGDSSFYSSYINKGILLEENEAKKRYEGIQEIGDFEKLWDPAWDNLF